MKKNKNENEEVSQEDLIEIRQMLDSIENQIQSIKKQFFSKYYENQAQSLSSIEQNIVEGVFDGEQIIGKDLKKYPVPANYASKSKLVAGDVLKLTISPDGGFLFKQIGPVKRKKVIGSLTQSGDIYYVDCKGKHYRVLNASITYFKANPGDKLTLLIPEEQESNWAAVENKIN